MPERPRLYAIIDSATLSARGVDLRTFAEDLRDAGVMLLQYRNKTSPPQTMLRAMDTIAEVFGSIPVKAVLNDRADLAALQGWGVHVGQGDLSVPDAQKLARTVGISTHTADQVTAADETDANYIAIGPIFGTQTKLDAEPAVGLDFVRHARTLTTKRLVAIGGITLENCRSVMDAGADVVAVISGLFVPGRTVREVAEDFLARLR